ncbi:amidase signature domain-containing protein [Melanogaster broomeanus]|nr:amidase signature domain-containing protein [Melanogaster broomeanus]
MAFAFWQSLWKPKIPGDISVQEVSQSVNFQLPDLYEAGIAELQQGLERGHFTSVDLVKAYLARIEEVNLKGAALRAVIETNPQALSQAAALDVEREVKGSRSPLHGIPLMLKDNIATLHEEGMNTTAGSYALLGSEVSDDAPVAAKLREAGAIFIAKTNMSEWAGYRGNVPSGFSGRGGQTLSPYYPNGDASGSSTGSGVAMAIGLAAGSLGSDTSGSITSPSSRNDIVGIRPTVGLASRTRVIPISSTQDTTGPMCRSVADAALLLSFIAGKDESDKATKDQPEIPDYMQALDKNALMGKTLGVPRNLIKENPLAEEEFNKALDTLRSLGANIVDPADFPNAEELKAAEYTNLVLTVELKVGVNNYISELRKRPVNINSLADVIKFNNENKEKELPEPYYTDQSQFYKSESSKEDEHYYEAIRKDYELGRAEGIDATLKKFKLDAIILPSSYSFATKAAAIAGYPVVTVPLGFVSDTFEPTPDPPTPLHTEAPGMPFGLCFMGTAYSEYQLIGLAYAFEQATQVRLNGRKAFAEAIPKTQLKDVMST